MSEKETKVTKQETLAALRNPGELYVIMSAATKMPFVKCDEETFDDEIFLQHIESIRTVFTEEPRPHGGKDPPPQKRSRLDHRLSKQCG